MTGPRTLDGSPVLYAQRLEALIECEREAVENFRSSWGNRHAGLRGSSYARDLARARLRRHLAGIRAMRAMIRMS